MSSGASNSPTLPCLTLHITRPIACMFAGGGSLESSEICPARPTRNGLAPLLLPAPAADRGSAMVDNRAPRGLLVSALGAAVLAVAMFLPWYSVSITPSGAAAAQQEFAAVAQQYGNANFQTMADQI